MNWQCESSIIEYENEIFSVGKGVCLNPRTGRKQSLYRLNMTDWVNVIARTVSGEFIFVRQYRHGIAAPELEVAGGCIDSKDESPLAAGMRELLEETGYSSSSAQLLGQCRPNPALQNNTCYFVYAPSCRKITEPHLDEGEDIEVCFLSPADLKRSLQDGLVGSAMVQAAFLQYSLAGFQL